MTQLTNNSHKSSLDILVLDRGEEFLGVWLLDHNGEGRLSYTNYLGRVSLKYIQLKFQLKFLTSLKEKSLLKKFEIQIIALQILVFD